MINLRQQAEIKEILQKHIGEAINEISELSYTNFFWGENHEDRLADQVLQTLLMLEESEDERLDNIED